ncbi:MAG: D-alanine--D-alanine ligase [Nitrospirae bacterium]|nr:D-alanine--D-alanine ligase [Nitrospirota bacterium]
MEGIKVLVTDRLIGVIAGGVSAEREVSLKSGTAVYNALKEKGYRVVFIDARVDVCEQIRNSGIEVAFLVLHGGWGENGAIQGMLEVMGIPYTGSGVLSSSIAMDKVISKKIFQYHGLKVPPYIVIHRDGYDEPDFSFPWVVKPAREGSSVGVSIVDNKNEFSQALEIAGRYGGAIIVEKYIKAKEVQVGILGQKVLGAVEVRPRRRFYDYVAKYTQGATEYILPPEIDSAVYRRVCDAALLAHQCIDCQGATRVDLLVDGDDEVYILEVNTIPGMTETSLLPKIAKQSGYDFITLLEEILKEALTL